MLDVEVALKNLLLAFGIALTAFVLLFTAPRIYERLLLPTDEAAIDFKNMTAEDAGKSVVECLNRQNGFGVWWDWNTEETLRAYEDLSGAWSPTHYYVSGRIGWHVTWYALLSFEQGTVKAYETYGAENGGDGMLFRRELPTRVIGGLKRCGVVYDGVFNERLPVPK